MESSQRSEGSMSSFPAIVPVVPTLEVGPVQKPLLFAWDARTSTVDRNDHETTMKRPWMPTLDAETPKK